ncbi:SDH family Clp fold serine proteinase [Deferribacter abyssi]|uniref:SDH family Clp fold serine proteinase n=1 Tax=Deferribacter abyssi TaxID=213806 RepID=UPI003C15BEB8
MGFNELFWLFFMLAAMQPVIKQRMIESARQRLIAKIEKNRGSRVILLVHRQETMSFLGFPVYKYINVDDSEEVLRAIQMTDDDVPIDLILHTPGGLVLASLQIARALKRHKGKVTVFVPHYAMSGGTLISLAADEIVMSENAVLGPVDPQLGEYPAASVLKLLEQKDINKIDDKTLILADISKKAINQLENAVYELLCDKYEDEKSRELAKILSTGTWTHDYPITFDEAKKMGLHVSSDIPTEVMQLMSLYPQPVRRTSSVEYLPIPKHKS